jgi:DNA-binding NarL/FixJ family response regulator
MNEISVLIVEDQTLMRHGLRTILELEPGLRVAGEAANGSDGLAQALALRPDVVLTDIQMPQLTGVEMTRAIIAAWPAARIVVLTTFDRDELVFEAVRAGAMGYMLKDAPADALISTVRRVALGEAFIQPEIAARALRELARPAAPRPVDALTERERDVLILLAQGASNKDIAQRLAVSEGTVKNHVSNLLAKLQASNRTQAANIARQSGLVDG